MGRAMTPQELEEFYKRRRKNLEETASLLGVTPEELERIEQGARESITRQTSKTAAEEALRKALDMISRGFIDNLKTDTHREALDTVENVNDISEEDFSKLLAERMSVLDEEERTEAAKVIARKIACWRGGADEPISLREEILLDLQAMIRRHNYYAER